MGLDIRLPELLNVTTCSHVIYYIIYYIYSSSFIVLLCKLIGKPNSGLAQSVTSIGFLELLQLFTEPYITNASYTDYPTGRKFSTEFKFRYFNNGKFTKFKFRLLLYF